MYKNLEEDEGGCGAVALWEAGGWELLYSFGDWDFEVTVIKS